MNDARPPRFPSLLMERIASTDDALLGDLVEEYHAGHSKAWFWRQALSVVTAATLRDLRRHWLIIIQGAGLCGLGWVVVNVLLFAHPNLTGLVADGIFRRMLPLEVYLRLQVYTTTAVVFGFLAATGVGWLVATTHRRQRVGVTLVLVLPFVPITLLDLRIYRIWQDAWVHWQFMSATTFFGHLALHILGVLTWPLGTFVGGVLLRVPLQGGPSPR